MRCSLERRIFRVRIRHKNGRKVWRTKISGLWNFYEGDLADRLSCVFDHMDFARIPKEYEFLERDQEARRHAISSVSTAEDYLAIPSAKIFEPKEKSMSKFLERLLRNHEVGDV